MQNIFTIIYEWLLRVFWATEMNISVIGLQNAGKTSLIRVLAGSEFVANSNPTVGFNVKRIQKGHVTLKCWDLGGQTRFRPMWERYCRDVNAIVFVVDTADRGSVSTAAHELHTILSQASLQGIPLLVLGNKSDLPDRLTVDELIDQFDLKSIRDREISCYGVSAKFETNLDAVVQWLVARSTTR
ncbi:DNA-directed RNA polymerase I subunit RPA2 [Ascosphaera pollenicola]|nr:DNA-directed RNA polymerase I subunit RPA2 [Ascosphaera pollenicola]